MSLAIKAQFEAVMNGSFAPHPFIKPHLRHQIDGPLLKHARTNGRFDRFSITPFENNRRNAFPREQQCQHQTRWACSNDSHLCSHIHHTDLLVSWESIVGSKYSAIRATSMR